MLIIDALNTFSKCFMPFFFDICLQHFIKDSSTSVTVKLTFDNHYSPILLLLYSSFHNTIQIFNIFSQVESGDSLVLLVNSLLFKDVQMKVL